MNIELPWAGKPDFINGAGIKWWLDKPTTKYAKNKLKNATVWIVQEPNGYITRLLLIEKDIVAEHQTLEGMACEIDILAIA
ncbi:MAG: hypothetical protein Q7R95_10735 [bacterium]|nr:hypothetical protein [bacterium]